MVSFNELTPEQMEKARACKSPADLVELAKSEGVELTDDQLHERNVVVRGLNAFA